MFKATKGPAGSNQFVSDAFTERPPHLLPEPFNPGLFTYVGIGFLIPTLFILVEGRAFTQLALLDLGLFSVALIRVFLPHHPPATTQSLGVPTDPAFDPFAERDIIDRCLATAADQIRGGQYEQARATLETIRFDQKAQEWLTRLNEPRYK